MVVLSNNLYIIEYYILISSFNECDFEYSIKPFTPFPANTQICIKLACNNCVINALVNSTELEITTKHLETACNLVKSSGDSLSFLLLNGS